MDAPGFPQAKIGLELGGLRSECAGGVHLPNINNTSWSPPNDKGCSLGTSSARFNYAYIYRLGDGTKPIERIYVNKIRGYGISFCGDENYPFGKIVGDVLGMKERTSVPGTIATCGQLYSKADNKLYFLDGDGIVHTVAFA